MYFKKINRLLICGLLASMVNGCGSKNVDSEAKARDTDAAYYGESKGNVRQAALANVELGQGYLDQGQVTRAKKKLVHALKLVPNLPEGLTAMGYFWEKVGDNKEAEKFYKRAIVESKSGKGTFYSNYGNFLCRETRYPEAEKAFENAIKDRDYLNTAEVYENAGICALRAGETGKAENYFMRAVRYDAKRSTAWLELTELAFKRGEIAQASEYLAAGRQQMELNPRLLWLSIQIAQAKHDDDTVASDGLLLKSKFADSAEYKQYAKI